MTPLFERLFLIPVMRIWHLARRSDYAYGPAPVDESSAHAPGADSDRILIFGSGIATGWGVLTNDLALPGHLARALSARTGRGTDVDVVAEIGITVRNATHPLHTIAVDRYDAVVVVLGMGEALNLESVTRWHTKLTTLLDRLLDRGTFDVIVAGIPSLRTVGGYRTRLGLLAEGHAKRFNRATADLCARKARTTFVWLSPTLAEPNRIGRPAENYRMWATEIADRAVPLLNASRAAGAYVVHDAARSETERRDSVRRLHILHTEPELRFDMIVDRARMLFNTGGAALAFIDGDNLWYKSAIGGLPERIPLEDSFTHATISQRGAVMIPDARTDPRFQNLAHVRGEPWIRFWAGFPIEDQNGIRVGTLSVFDSEPRLLTPNDNPAILRQFALMVQHELHRPAASD